MELGRRVLVEGQHQDALRGDELAQDRVRRSGNHDRRLARTRRRDHLDAVVERDHRGRLLVGERLLLDGVEETPPDGQLIDPDLVIGSCDDSPKVLGEEAQQIPSLRTSLCLLGQLLDFRRRRRLASQPRVESLARDPPTSRDRIGYPLLHVRLPPAALRQRRLGRRHELRQPLRGQRPVSEGERDNDDDRHRGSDGCSEHSHRLPTSPSVGVGDTG